MARAAGVYAYEIVPLENEIRDMQQVDQFVHQTQYFTSRYNAINSISYAPLNLVDGPTKYPDYGDFPSVYMVKEYGTWLKNSGFYQETFRALDEDPLEAEEYIVVRYKKPVIPRQLNVYETFNPGAVVRVWGRISGGDWLHLWEAASQQVAQNSRRFVINLRTINSLINEVRLDLNLRHLTYHTAFDAIELCGLLPVGNYHNRVNWNENLRRALVPAPRVPVTNEYNPDVATELRRLPSEMILEIFRKLDLISLTRCGRVSRTWRLLTRDASLFHDVTLQPYWHMFGKSVFVYLRRRCTYMRRFNMNWCRSKREADVSPPMSANIVGLVPQPNIREEPLPGQPDTDDNDFASVLATFRLFVPNNMRDLTHLSLNHCNLIGNMEVELLCAECGLLEHLRLRYCLADDYLALRQLMRLRVLDVCSTAISDEAMLAIIQACVRLKSLCVDFCDGLLRMDDVTAALAQHSRDLRDFSAWKTSSMTATGVEHLGQLSELSVLDLGWVLAQSNPGTCLQALANGCHNLKRLVLAQWRALSDEMIVPILQRCKRLQQIDLQGARGVSLQGGRQILASLPELRLLDVTNCPLINTAQVNDWRDLYEHITIHATIEDQGRGVDDRNGYHQDD